MPRNSTGSLRPQFFQLKASQPEELMPCVKADLSARTADGWASQGVVAGGEQGSRGLRCDHGRKWRVNKCLSMHYSNQQQWSRAQEKQLGEISKEAMTS